MTLQTLWTAVRKSLKGEHHDFTKGNISESVILLAIPMILELSLESVFAVVDMFFVSRLGPNAIATVGLTESVVTLIYSLAIGLSVGATAIVARRIGEKNPEAAAHAGAQSLILAIGVSVILAVLGASFAGDILQMMGASAEVVMQGTPFAQILLGGSTAIILLFLINGIFRGAGDAAMAMRSLWIASGVNIILCPILIHFFGLSGAAMATVIGRSSGVCYQCYHLFKGNSLLRFVSRHFHWDPSVVKSLVQIASPASFQFIIGSGSWILLTRLVAETGGTEASAGYQIAFRSFVFFILPAWGLSNAAATLVGQNLGAKQIERAEESVWTTNRYSVILMSFVTVLFLLGANNIVQIFTKDPIVAQYATEALRWIGSGYIFYGVGMVMTQALNGAGDTRTPTWLNFFCFWILQIPLAYTLVKQLNFGVKGAIIAVPISHFFLALLAILAFRRGKWKAVKV